MIHSTLYNKNTNEDPKTSTIFEHILLLPDNIIWEILLESNRTFYKDLPVNVGFLESFEFWPKWNPHKTTNTSYVEPDIFLRFSKLDIIIEAKVSDESGQNKNEWKREIQAYKNEYSNDKKNVVLYAVGGNKNFISDNIGSCKILKTSWKTVLNNIVKIKNNYSKKSTSFEKASLNRILDLIIEGFHIMGENENKTKSNLSEIKNLSTLIQMFDDVCGSRETKEYFLSKYSAAGTATYYNYRFKTQFKNKKEEIYLGLSIWYSSGIIALEIKPQKLWAEPVAKLIKNNDKLFKDKYHTESYIESGIYYIEGTEKMYEDFSNAETYDLQLKIIKKFIDSFLTKYIATTK